LQKGEPSLKRLRRLGRREEGAEGATEAHVPAPLDSILKREGRAFFFFCTEVV
jgi:hypothetical protein